MKKSAQLNIIETAEEIQAITQFCQAVFHQENGVELTPTQSTGASLIIDIINDKIEDIKNTMVAEYGEAARWNVLPL